MIAITIKRKIAYFKTPYKVKPEQWDNNKKEIINYPNSSLLNQAIRKLIADHEKEITEKILSGEQVTTRSIKSKRDTISFEDYAHEVKLNPTEITRISDFAPGILLSEINSAFLRRFDANEKNRGMANNTRTLTFKRLNTVMKKAVSEGLIKLNPVQLFDKPKFRRSEMNYLEEEEKKKLFKLLQNKNLDTDFRTTTIYFLLGCYSGLRHSDWRKFDAGKMVSNGFLKLRAQKNKNDVVLPIGITLKKILTLIKTAGTADTNKNCNAHLRAISLAAGINKKITTHTARHSFGHLCATNKLPKSVTAELMAIDEETVKVYYHLSGEDIISQAAVMKKI